MEVVGELHRGGYEGLRLHAALAPSGCHWRGAVYAGRSPEVRTPTYSSGAGFGMLFELQAAERDSAAELARRFLERFPEVARAGQHADPAYATWYAAMLTATSPHRCIYFVADFDLPPSGVGVSGAGKPPSIPPPPAAG